MSIGDKVTWKAVNGQREGVVEEVREDCIIVRLADGRYVQGDKNSFTKI